MDVVLVQGGETVVSYRGTRIAVIDAGWYLSLVTMNGVNLKNYDGPRRHIEARIDLQQYVDEGVIY